MSNSANDERGSEVEEDGSLVSGRRRRQLGTGAKIAIAIAIVLLFIFYSFIAHFSAKHQDAKTPPDMNLSSQQFRQAPIKLPPPEPEPLPAVRHIYPPQRRSRELTAAESPIFAFAGSESSAGAPILSKLVPSARVAEAAPASTSLSTRLQPTTLQLTKAKLLPHPDMLITQGTIIACTLQTAISTELPGYVKCILPNDVRSTTGNVVLLDRGTVVTGEIQSGLQSGQGRVFVLWDRAETPDHAVITLSSPGADELGRAGLSGAMNNHLLQRFGGAVMLSVIQGSLQAATALAANSGGGGGNYLNNFQSSGSQVANSALEASINIPPTLEKNQGDNVSIFVARDLDFSDIYNLRLNDGG